MYHYVCTVHAIYSIVIYSSTNFGYTECSVRYSVLCNTVVLNVLSVQCTVCCIVFCQVVY